MIGPRRVTRHIEMSFALAKYAAASLTLTLAIVGVIAPARARTESLAPWMVIKPGAIAYLDDEGGQLNTPGRRIVCADLTAFLDLREVDGGRRCVVRHAFGLVKVERIVGRVALTKKAPQRVPIVAIHSLSEGWSGVVIGLALLPKVPIGARLELERGAGCSRSRDVRLVDGTTPADGFELTERTPIEVVRQVQPDSKHYPILVKILAGKHHDEHVWTLLFTSPYPAFWMQDPADIVP
jgi:hypothetical protein